MRARSAPKASTSRASGSAKRTYDLRRRLSPDPSKPITQERLARFLGVSWSTVARWETDAGHPDSHMDQKLTRLVHALDALGDMVVREDRLLFFEQEHPLLLGLRPVDLLDNDRGAMKVIELLEGAASGAFA